MRIDLVALCDAAVEVNGRLHVLGSIDYFWASALPYVHPKCVLAARLRWDGHERAKKHRLRVQIMNADGALIATELERKLLPPVVDNEDIPAVRHMIVDLEDLRFESYGPYAVRVEVDREELAYLPFSIVALGARRPQQVV
jgi:hypothetical protein